MAGLNRAYKRRPSMVAMNGGPVLCLDAGSKLSYPGSGTTWTDLSGNGNNGTLTNGPTFDSANGGSIVFDGSSTYINTTIKLFTTQQFTIYFWIKVNLFTGTACSGAVSNSLYSIFGTTAIYQGFTNTFSACVQTGANSNSTGTVTQSNYPTGVWHNYCAVYDGSQTGNAARLQLFINAVNKTLTYDATVPSNPYNNNTNTRVGFGPAGNYPYFNGSISNVNYYSRALSAAEISTNFELLRGRYGI